MAAERRVTINLTESDYKVLTTLAKRHSVSMAWLGRQALHDFIERYRDEDVQLPLALPNRRGVQ